MPISYRGCGCLLVTVLSPERFAEIGGIDFYPHSFGKPAARFASVYL